MVFFAEEYIQLAHLCRILPWLDSHVNSSNGIYERANVHYSLLSISASARLPPATSRARSELDLDAGVDKQMRIG